MHKSKNCCTYSAVIKLVNQHHEPPVLLYFSGFPGWLAWFSLQIFCLNNKIHFSLANANNSVSFKRKMVWKWRFLLIHKQQTNLWMKLPTIPPGLAGKIVKYSPLSEPIRLQDLEDSARSQAWKKKSYVIWIAFQLDVVLDLNVFDTVFASFWHLSLARCSVRFISDEKCCFLET